MFTNNSCTRERVRSFQLKTGSCQCPLLMHISITTNVHVQNVYIPFASFHALLGKRLLFPKKEGLFLYTNLCNIVQYTCICFSDEA